MLRTKALGLVGLVITGSKAPLFGLCLIPTGCLCILFLMGLRKDFKVLPDPQHDRLA